MRTRLSKRYISPRKDLGALVFQVGSPDASPVINKWWFWEDEEFVYLEGALVQDSAGTAGSGTYDLTIPSWIIAMIDDTSYLGTDFSRQVGTFTMNNSSGAGTWYGPVCYNTTNDSLRFFLIQSGSTGAAWQSGSTPNLSATDFKLSFSAKIRKK
jgi:hypothetical protein